MNKAVVYAAIYTGAGLWGLALGAVAGRITAMLVNYVERKAGRL